MSGPATSVRPKDAASLVLFDRSRGDTRFLMGVRAAGHVFMPGHLVFPGGRLEPSDLTLARHLPVEDEIVRRLMLGSPKLASPRRAAALALAAIRETQEETGLLVAERGALPDMVGAWAPFSAAGALPSPGSLVPLARAITPPGLPLRFDARFFLASADSLLERGASIVPPSGELETVLWVGPNEIQRYRVAPITQLVLRTALQRLEDGTERDQRTPIPFFRRRRGRHTTEYL